MQRINTTDGRFKNYNKINLTAGTVITAEWLNAVQEEITNAIEAFGVSLSANNNDQLKNIITNILNNKVDTSNADSLFPSMSGQIGKFLCTDGTTRFWSDPVTNLFALLSSKGIVYIDGSNKAKTSSSLTWDYTNNRLGIGTQTPNNTIHIPGLINFNPTTLSTFLGILAGNVSTGLNNIGIGSEALRLATSAASNIAVGNASLYSLLSGINNTAIGYNAGYLNTGSNNVFIGYQAGYNETGSQKLYIANTSTSTPLIYGDFSTGRLGFGTTTLTDRLNISGSITISDQIKSTLSTGTAPLIIASTTLVSNLNADLLDGQEGSYYTNASNLSSGTISADRLPTTLSAEDSDTVDTYHATKVAGINQIPVVDTDGTLNIGYPFERPSTNKCTCYGVIPADTLGSEKVTNGGFDSDTQWSKSASASISSGTLNLTDATGALTAYQFISASAGKIYRVTFTIVTRTGGSVQFMIGDTSISSAYSTVGTFSFDLMSAGGDGGYFYISPTAFTGSLDNISVKEIIWSTGTKSFHNGSTFVQNITGLTLSGDTAAILSIVTDQTEIEKAGLAGINPGYKVYKLDNSAGTGSAYAATVTPGNTNVHTVLIVARKLSGTGTSHMGIGGTNWVTLAGTSYSKLSGSGTPASSSSTTRITAGIGDIIYFLLPQLEELPYATNVIPTAGSSTSRIATKISGTSFIRSSAEYITDYEGNIRKIESGSAPGIEGSRVVTNLLTYSEDLSNAAWSKYGTTTVTGTNTVNIPAIGDRIFIVRTANVNEIYRLSATLSGTGTVDIQLEMPGAAVATKTITLSSVPTRYSVTGTSSISGNSYVFPIRRNIGNTATSVTVHSAQLENVTAQTNQNPGEYIKTTSAAVTKCFSTTNGNTVDANGVVTEATGTILPQQYPERENSKQYQLNDKVQVNGWWYNCTTAGTSSSSAPTFAIGKVSQVTVTDGAVTWTLGGKLLKSLIPSTVETAKLSGNMSITDDASFKFGIGTAYLTGSSSDNLIRFITGSIERCRVTSNGNFLIGSATDDGVNKLQVTGSITTTSQIKSTLTTGTSPFSIASTTLVTNLNADLLDGQEGSYYTNASNISTGTLSADRLPSINASDSDTVDTFHASQTAGASQIPVLTTGANLLLGTATDDAVNKLQVTGSGIFTSSLSVSSAVSTGAATLNVGKGRTGNGTAEINLVGDTTYTGYGFRIYRGSTANGTTQLYHRGTGSLQLIAGEAAAIVFGVSGAEVARVSSAGRLLLGSDTDDAANKLQVTGRAIANGFVHRSYNQAGADGPWSLDASNASYTKITPAQSNSVTVTNGTKGQEIIINITAVYNSSYTITFSTGFRSSGTISSPATTGYSKIVKFVHDGTSFIEVSRTGDIPS